MIDERCIAVAKEVWGWEQVGDPDADELIGDGFYWTYSKVEREVNSWQGFGRTVEAVFIKNNGKVPTFFIQAISRVTSYTSSQCVGFNIDKCTLHIFDSTHLAAFEAMREKL